MLAHLYILRSTSQLFNLINYFLTIRMKALLEVLKIELEVKYKIRLLCQVGTTAYLLVGAT